MRELARIVEEKALCAVKQVVDCIEGQAHPPIGDWRLDEARALSDQLILCGEGSFHEPLRGGDSGRVPLDAANDTGPGVAVASIAGVRLPGEVSSERPPLARRWPGDAGWPPVDAKVRTT